MQLDYIASRHAYSRTTDYLFAQLIPYIGSKRKLLPVIGQAVEASMAALSKPTHRITFADLFAGSGVVCRMAKQLGFRVVANDWEPYAEVLNGATISLNQAPLPPSIFDEMNNLPPLDGFVARHYCPRDDNACDPLIERMFYTRANGMRIDAIRSKIAEWDASGSLSDEQRYYLLAPLLSAASYVANTSGVFKAYHAGWGGKTQTAHYRILSEMRLSPPPILDNGHCNIVTRLDAASAAGQLEALTGEACDILYLDPPYNQHPYGSNYHMLNTIALYDFPDVPSMVHGGKSAIRTDWRTERRSAYNSASTALAALLNVVDNAQCRIVLLSYSTDGNIQLEALLKAFASRGHISIYTQRYKRYRVSAQRMSPQSHNVEFVLMLDKGASPTLFEADECMRSIEEAGTIAAQ